MHYTFWHKFGLSTLLTLWLLAIANWTADALITVPPPAKNAPKEMAEDAGDATEGADGGTGTAEAAGGEPVDALSLLAGADMDAGRKGFKKCKACHTVDEGGKNKVGPNLWNVVGADKAAHADFRYSDALLAMDGNWTYESLDAFLHKPKDYAPGTKMAFAGLKKPRDRAAMILYLRSLSSDPKPLP